MSAIKEFRTSSDARFGGGRVETGRSRQSWGRRGGRDRAAPGSASLPPAARAACAALHIPRPCAFHALKTAHNREECEEGLADEAARLIPKKRIRARAHSGAESPYLLLCAGKSVPGFSQQGQTINVRAVNARALAQALVSLRADPCIARLSARFSILCCENPFTLKDTQENAQ